MCRITVQRCLSLIVVSDTVRSRVRQGQSTVGRERDATRTLFVSAIDSQCMMLTVQTMLLRAHFVTRSVFGRDREQIQGTVAIVHRLRVR